MEDKNQKEQQFVVSGKILLKSSYCGGARPTPAILERYKTPKPLVDYDLYVKEGLKNNDSTRVLASTKTDSEGNYSFALPKGNYVLVSHNQLTKKNLAETINQKDIKLKTQECLDEWYDKGLMQFTVVDRPFENIDHVIRKKCYLPDGIPCLKYTGKIRP